MKLTDKKLFSIVQNFFLEAKNYQFSPLTSGHINDTFRVDCTRGSYVLQRINTKVFPNPQAIVENALKVAKYLKKSSYRKKILTPMLTLENKLLHQDTEGHYWRMTPFFANTVTLEKPENIEQAYKAAAAFGNFSGHLNDLSPKEIIEIIPHFHDANFRKKQFEEVLKNAREKRLQKAGNEILFLQNQFSFLAEMSALNFPLRITHNDTKISNILFDIDKKNVVAVIDWDTIMPGTILSDFGDCVRTFCVAAAEDETNLTQVIFREDYYEAVEKGFLSTTKDVLTDLEKKYLRKGAKRVILVQAMRFLTDYLAENIYYKTDYEWHNLERARNQFEIYRQMN